MHAKSHSLSSSARELRVPWPPLVLGPGTLGCVPGGWGELPLGLLELRVPLPSPSRFLLEFLLAPLVLPDPPAFVVGETMGIADLPPLVWLRSSPLLLVTLLVFIV